MKAGPELDALVDQHVMGITEGHHDCPCCQCRPIYSSDRSLAMDVFETMIKRVGFGTIDGNMEHYKNGEVAYWVRFAMENGQGNAACCGLFEETICITALLALGVDVVDG